jgi:hypothetical protein
VQVNLRNLLRSATPPHASQLRQAAAVPSIELIKAGLNVQTCRSFPLRNVYISMPVTISRTLPAPASIGLALLRIAPSQSRTNYPGFQGEALQ